MIRRYAAAFASAVIIAQSCAAQATGAAYGEKILFRDMASVTMGAAVHSWRIGDRLRLVEGIMPMNLAMPVMERGLFTISAVPASVSQGGGSIGGVPETRFGASYVLPGEQLWLTGAVSMPTGTTRLTSEQTKIAASLAQPALGYPQPSMGHGLNSTLGCAYASSASRLIVFGFGAAISTKGSYEPVVLPGTSALTYAPGNELAANMGIDYHDGVKANRVSADYTVTYYFSDRINGGRFFQSGIKAAFLLVGTHASRTLLHMLSMRFETRARNVSIVAGGELRSPSALRLTALYTASMSVRADVAVTAGLELRTMTSDEFPVGGEIITSGGGTVGELSAECRYAPAQWCVLSPHCSFGVGSVTMMNSTMHAAGFDAGIGVKFLL